MNSHSQWRLELAQQAGAAYAANPKVAAVMVSGSTARGHADRFSDIELGVYWHEPPTRADRAKAVEAIGADLIALHPYYAPEELWPDDFMMGRAANNKPKSGVLVEVINHTTNFAERVLDDVLLRHQPDPLKQNQIAGILQSIPLAGQPLLEGWKARGAVYPKELAAAIISQQGQIDHYWRWQQWLIRGHNLFMLHQQLVDVQQRLLHVLLALNHQFYSGFKWLDLLLAGFKIAPDNFSERFKAISQLPPQEAIDTLGHLVEETYNLVEVYIPGVDVNRLRDIFRWQRPQWEHRPPLD